MNRYINTERLGVNATELIVVKNLEWVFREQPIVDVGIDAIIEQVEEGSPTGRFIAVQIKSGESNFHISEDKLTYYVSHIHYNYWLNLQIPIIIVAHLPKTEKTYWQVISERTFTKAKKQWKIDIPRKQVFNKNSKSRLTQILSSASHNSFVFDLYKGKIEPDTFFDIIEKTDCLIDAKDCLINVTEYIESLGTKANEFSKKLSKYIDEDKLSYENPKLKASIKTLGKDFNLLSSRLEHEITLFSELYSESFSAYKQLCIYYCLFTQNTGKSDVSLIPLKSIPESFDRALDGINGLRNAASTMPSNHAVLKEAKIFLLEILNLIINELTEGKKMTRKIIEDIEVFLPPAAL